MPQLKADKNTGIIDFTELVAKDIAKAEGKNPEDKSVINSILTKIKKEK